MQPPPKLSSHLIDGLGRLIADHGHGSHALEIPPDTEAMLLQLEVAVQELRSSLIAAGPVAFRPQQDLAADSNEHVGQQWAMCCSLWETCLQVQAKFQDAKKKTGTMEPLQDRLHALARDLFDVITDNGLGFPLLLELPDALLKMGRRWIEVGENDQAEWFIAQARQLHSLCLDKLSGSWATDAAESASQQGSAQLSRLMGVQCDILLSSLQLAIAGNQKAPQANLLLQLKLLTQGGTTPTPVRVRAVQGIAGLHLAAAMSLLSSRPAEAVRMLQQAYQMVSDQAAILCAGLVEHDGDPMGQTSELLARLDDTGLQLIRALIMCHLGTGGFDSVIALTSSYLKARGFPPAAGGPATGTVSAASAATGSRPRAISWDVWLLSAKARVALEQLAEVLSELRQALGMGCGSDVACTALKGLLQPLYQVRKLSEDMLHGVNEAVKACIKLFDQAAAAQIILLVVEALLASDEGDEGGPRDRVHPPDVPTGQPRPLESCALRLLADDEVQEAVSQVKARCHTMLHCCGAGYYQRRDYAQAHRLFIAALHYAVPRHYSASARMVAVCCRALGMYDNALAYLGLAEQHDPAGACSLLRLCTLISKGGNTDTLLAAELNRFISSPDFDSSHLQYVISEALSVAITRPSCARVACDAINLLKASTGSGCHAPCPEGDELRQLELSKLWLQAWAYLRPGRRAGGAAAGEEGMGLQAWLQQAVEELVSACSMVQAADGSSWVVEPSMVAWMAEMAMSLGVAAMQAELWKECHAAMLCCFQLCNKSAFPAATAAQELPPVLQISLFPSGCAAAQALLQLFLQHASSKTSGLPAPSVFSLLSASCLRLAPTSTASTAHEEAPTRPQVLVEAAQDLLASCRKTMKAQVQQGAGTAAADRPGTISAVEIESLEFRAATYLRSEVGQKRALQALLSSPGLRGADLEPLAAACLERQPWRNVGIACAVMGFALRVEHSAADPDYVLIARAIRTLYQLSSSDAIKLRVCERAVAALEGLKSTAAADPGNPNHTTLVQEHNPAVCAYPASEIHWLYTSCLNEALRHSQRLETVEASAINTTTAEEPRPLSKEGLRYLELAGALSAYRPGGDAASGTPVARGEGAATLA